MEACWAHNPEVRGSKPRSAKRNILLAALVDSLSWTEQEGKKTIERVDISSYDSFMHEQYDMLTVVVNNVSLHLQHIMQQHVVPK